MSETLGRLATDLAGGRIEVVDLTQPLGPETPVIQLPDEFVASPPVEIEELSHYDHRGPAWYWNSLKFGEHSGTHFDAPIHWISGRDVENGSCDLLPARSFIGPACVIDVTRQVSADEDFLVTPSHIADWEEEHGRIPAGSWFLVRSGWSRRTGSQFQNICADGSHSPGFAQEASELLVDRDILGVGVETIGTDAGQAGTFPLPYPNHAIMHGAGKLGLTSLCNLEKLPATGAIVIAAPLKIVGGSGSPARVLALVSS